ncbi:helix-turn-helix domain-containing protein [Rhodococcus sp. ABRD24]|uniref:helix-turn-helix domain-containing protein n=1 Tax=Rhodococcus sp. ABRD24 TaxID=2507582 RepID=UPI001F60292B|nr:helix-turn-helix domain-containing protein [Rhodococcus sp. ABRD24]
MKLDVVQRFLAGETKADLATDLGLSSVQLLEKWVREYRRDGEDALRPPKPKGRRPRSDSAVLSGEVWELERLRRENDRLRAEVDYLGKLRALENWGP